MNSNNLRTNLLTPMNDRRTVAQREMDAHVAQVNLDYGIFRKTVNIPVEEDDKFDTSRFDGKTERQYIPTSGFGTIDFSGVE
jgi:hypothetical protein